MICITESSSLNSVEDIKLGLCLAHRGYTPHSAPPAPSIDKQRLPGALLLEKADTLEMACVEDCDQILIASSIKDSQGWEENGNSCQGELK